MEYQTVELSLFVKVQVSSQNPHSWEALQEAYEIVKVILEKDNRIRQISTEGIHSVG